MTPRAGSDAARDKAGSSIPELGARPQYLTSPHLHPPPPSPPPPGPRSWAPLPSLVPPPPGHTPLPCPQADRLKSEKRLEQLQRANRELSAFRTAVERILEEYRPRAPAPAPPLRQ